MRILVVEDDAPSRAILKKLLEGTGRCDEAADGEEGVAAVGAALEAKDPYALICLDIMMPNMDGQAALKSIRKMEVDAGIMLGDGAKILITTALKDSKNVMQAFRANCDGYLTKPYDKEKLEKELEKLELATG